MFIQLYISTHHLSTIPLTPLLPSLSLRSGKDTCTKIHAQLQDVDSFPKARHTSLRARGPTTNHSGRVRRGFVQPAGEGMFSFWLLRHVHDMFMVACSSSSCNIPNSHPLPLSPPYIRNSISPTSLVHREKGWDACGSVERRSQLKCQITLHLLHHST